MVCYEFGPDFGIHDIDFTCIEPVKDKTKEYRIILR